MKYKIISVSLAVLAVCLIFVSCKTAEKPTPDAGGKTGVLEVSSKLDQTDSAAGNLDNTSSKTGEDSAVSATSSAAAENGNKEDNKNKSSSKKTNSADKKEDKNDNENEPLPGSSSTVSTVLENNTVAGDW